MLQGNIPAQVETDFTNQLVDSLLQLVENDKSDSSKVKYLNEIAWQLAPDQPVKSLEFAEKAFSLASKLKWETMKAEALNNMGDALRINGELLQSIEKHKKALEIYFNIDDEMGVANTRSKIGISYFNISDFDKSSNNFDLALNIYKHLNNKQGIAKNLSYMAILFGTFGDNKKALGYFEQSLSISRELNEQNNIAIQLGNIGLTYYKLKDYKRALSHFQDAIDLFKKMEDSYNLSIFLGDIGLVYADINEYDKALKFYSESLKYSVQIDDEYGIAQQYGNLGDLFLKQVTNSSFVISVEKNALLNKSISYLTESTKLFSKLGVKEDEMNFLFSLAEAHSKNGNYKKAFEIYKGAIAQKDSVFSADHKKTISELGIKQDLNLREKEIEILNFEKENNETKNNLLLAVIVFFITISGTLVFFYIRKRKDNLILEDSIKVRREAEEILKANEVELKNYKDHLEQLVAERTKDLEKEIQERKLIESALKEMNEIFRLFVKHNPVYVFIKDSEIRTLYLSDNYTTMLGRPIEELIGKTMDDLFPSELSKSMIEDDKRILREGKPIEVIENLDGRIYSTLKFPITIDGKPKYLAGYTTDITERKKNEAEILLAKERAETVSKAKTIFLANMSHELRTPLVGILGYSGMLTNEVLSPEHKEMAEGINRTGIRLLNTLSLVLDLTRIESDKHEIHNQPIDIIPLLKQIHNEFYGGASLKGLEFHLKLHSESCIVNIDSEMLKVIIDNIINNAIKFTEKGSVSLESEIEIRDGISHIVLKIEDTGIGIGTGDIPEIFKEFKQLSEGTTKDFPGTGLGLSITKKYVELLQGEIHVESKLGVGTEFILSFPL